MTNIKEQTKTLLNQMVLNFEAYQLNEYIYSNNPSESYQKYMELDWIETALYKRVLKMDNIEIIQSVLNNFQNNFQNNLIFSILTDNKENVLLKIKRVN